jgi:hypothetical protein
VAGSLSARPDGLPRWPARRPGPPGHFVPGATAQLLDWFKRGAGPSSNAGIFELYRQRAEELRSGEVAAATRCVCAPPHGVGAVQLLSGARRNVAGDGTVEMSQSDAAPLLLAGRVYADTGG